MRATRGGLVGPVVALVLGLAACGSPAPPPPPPDPAVQAYCDTIRRVQAEQSAPNVGQRGLGVESEITRRQIAALVRTSLPEIAKEWRSLQRFTNASLAVLAASGGDARRIDRPRLERIKRDSTPTAQRIAAVTEQRCGVVFRPSG